MSNDPPFATRVQTSHAIQRPSRTGTQTASSHANSSGQPPQSSASAAWEGRSDIHLVEHQYEGHTSNALASGGIPSTQSQPSGSKWPILDNGDGSIRSSDFHRAHIDQPWGVVAQQSGHEEYAHQPHYEHPARPSTPAQSSRRPSAKRKAAKVPSSFVERQEKLKVSKRKGPLPDKQREKTHTMRKTKRICVRCRFYKSGVSVLRHFAVSD
jgi:hypothetical protein